MKTITYYECEICGERFKYEENCQAHERWHTASKILAHGAKFYDLNGNLLTLDEHTNLEDFTELVYGIDCPSVAVAEEIQEIWENIGYCAPFDDIGTASAPCRVMYNPATYTWFNADEQLARIKKQFGEK